MTTALLERAGIPHVARQTAWILSQWPDASTSALFLSLHEHSQADRYSKKKEPPLSIKEDAEYLADVLGNTGKGGFDFFRTLSRGWRLVLGRPHPLIPIEPRLFTDVLWENYFAPSLPSRCRDLLAHVSLFRSSLCRQEVLTRSRAYLPSPALDTKEMDFVIFQNPTSIRVSRNTIKIIRLHDLVPLLRFDTQPRDHYVMRDFYRALAHCVKDSYFACVSESTRDELISLFPSAKAKSFVVPNSVTLPSFQREETRAAAFTEPYFLAVGTIEPRKNYCRLLEAFQVYRTVHNASHRLILVGHSGWHNKEELDAIKRAKKEGWLTWLKQASPDELAGLYQNAFALVSPSVHEGFGIPPLEAAGFGTPCVLSSLPVFKAHFGDAAEYFDPYDPLSLTQALVKMTPARRDQLSAESRKKAEQFHPDNELARWQELFTELASRKR